MSLDVWLQVGEEEVYGANITHNLNKMADVAGLYQHVWRPDENGIVYAHQLTLVLSKGLVELLSKPNVYKEYDDTNGWGTYNDFVPWIAKYLAACCEFPQATVHVSR